MKICIVGLGAIGGLFAARLSRSGQSVSALARGHTLAAVRRDGLVLLERDAASVESRWSGPVHVAESAAELGPQDLVVITLKSQSLPGLAGALAPLLGPDTTVLSAMNGVPWWFFHGLPGAPPDTRLNSVDPGGVIAAAIDPARVVGSVVHMSASCPAPGVVRHAVGDRLIVGEPAGGPPRASARCAALMDAFSAAGFTVEPSERIQQAVWFKLWGNMTMNPVSGFTGATADRILDDELVRGFLSRVMLEAAAIGERIGLPIADDPEARHAVTRRIGAFKTSMLQDVEARRPVELDALVSAVIEIGCRVGVPTPWTDTLFGLARLHARTLGLYPPA